MINSLVDKIIFTERLVNPAIFRDIDGPGTGNAAVVDYVERPREGGILVHLFHYKYPYKGCPDMTIVMDLHLIKKVIHYALQSIVKAKKTTKLTLYLLFILPNWLTRGIRETAVDYFYSLTEWKLFVHLLKPERYCSCVRELYRTFTVLIDRQEEGWIKKLITFIRDLFCMFIEYDSAYKFRFQDVSAEVNKEELINNPSREIQRLFDILLVREKDNKTKTGMGSKWKNMKKMFKMVSYLPFFKKMIIDFAKEVDLEKLKPDEGDRYFNMLRLDYDFFGKSLEERIAMKKEIEGNNWEWFEDIAKCFITDRNNFVNLVEEKFKMGI